MKSHSLPASGLLVGALCALGLGGCATTQDGSYAGNRGSSWAAAPGLAELSSYKIRRWSAPDDMTLLIEANDGTRYRAEMAMPCRGLATSPRIQFENRGGFSEIDRTSAVVLMDGTECAFHSFDRLVAPESKALDSYEKHTKDEGSKALDSYEKHTQESSSSETSGEQPPQR